MVEWWPLETALTPSAYRVPAYRDPLSVSRCHLSLCADQTDWGNAQCGVLNQNPTEPELKTGSEADIWLELNCTEMVSGVQSLPRSGAVKISLQLQDGVWRGKSDPVVNEWNCCFV